MLKLTPKTILIICHQRIGDVLFITPVISSLKAQWPSAQIDVLVTANTEHILKNNPYIRHLITAPHRSSFQDRLALVKQLWRAYDLSIATTANTKSIVRGFLFSKFRVGFFQQGIKGWLKKLTLNKSVPFQNETAHLVRQNLELVTVLGIQPDPTVKVYWSDTDQEQVETLLPQKDMKFVVLHPFPKFQYKMWRESEWKAVIQWLRDKGIHVVLTGSELPQEKLYIDGLCEGFSSGVTNLAGKLSLSMMGCLISKAAAYVGVDTAPTHIAAASGVPTIALFGPSNPIKWGPWPVGCQSVTSPYQFKGSQRQGNVVLLQSDFSCVPCLNEGCESHINSKSQCLDLFPAEKVIQELARLI